MKVVECRGSRRKIGEAIGEALRDEISLHLQQFVYPQVIPDRMRLLGDFTDSLKRHLPHLIEQLDGIARGAGVVPSDIYTLNLPGRQVLIDRFSDEECSNVVFGSGSEGPLWGKNNEGGFPPGSNRRPVAVLKTYPDHGIPSICFTFCGWLSGGDMINAEGVAVGHSSTGSLFSQSRHHVPALLWLYDCMLRSRSVGDYVRLATSLPTCGKGFTQVAVDKKGDMLSLEIACPVMQIRLPGKRDPAMNCVNRYQLPLLEHAGNRSPEQLKNAMGRQRYLENATSAGNLSLDKMKSILEHHGNHSICRHGGKDMSYTEYSMIGIPWAGKALFLQGYPCEEEYREVMI
ncbi:MAG: C45 family autoproteolytic acyltransferase/hydrolase [bacterium]|nr:C45 family autoproteolytic acyltransferase/hydrolase [bacterium]